MFQIVGTMAEKSSSVPCQPAFLSWQNWRHAQPARLDVGLWLMRPKFKSLRNSKCWERWKERERWPAARWMGLFTMTMSVLLENLKGQTADKGLCVITNIYLMAHGSTLGVRDGGKQGWENKFGSCLKRQHNWEVGCEEETFQWDSALIHLL